MEARLDTLAESGVVDLNIFSQILEMDEPDDTEFSQSIVFGFFDQADDTFSSMDTALQEENLEKLKELGHFLKGSSATLGLTQLKDSCEKIQHYGDMKDASGLEDVTDKKICLERLTDEIVIARREYRESERVLRAFYAE